MLLLPEKEGLTVFKVTIQVIARMKSDFPTKFGIPRQSGLVDTLRSTVNSTRPMEPGATSYSSKLMTRLPSSSKRKLWSSFISWKSSSGISLSMK